MSWRGMAAWWRGELSADPAYEEEVTPLLLELAEPEPDWRVLDAGCGEGRVMRALRAAEARPVGMDIDHELLVSASRQGPVVEAALPSLGCFVDGVFDCVLLSLVLEHIADAAAVFRETARVCRPGGRLVLVVNHPFYTAPGSAPIQEPDEVLWRPGTYLTRGHTDEPAGGHVVRFHHRPMAFLLTAAAEAGWDLRRMVERGVGEGQVGRHPALGDQRHIPRLMGARWQRAIR